MISSIVTAVLVLGFICLLLENIGTIIIWAIIFFLVGGVFIWLFVKLTTPKYRYITKNCPWGYHKYGCHPDCPMHEHCWGPNPMNDNSANHNSDFFFYDSDQSSIPDIPTFQNEDGDWRTTYMDDIRYDDRERDEEYDHDRFDNGGW